MSCYLLPQIESRYPLLSHNSLGVPAVCEGYAEVEDLSQVDEALAWARGRSHEIFVLGEGTNLVLFGDYSGLVIRPLFMGIEVLGHADNAVDLAVGAGENWHQLVCWSLKNGYYGLENLALIPGSCGAAPVQNIGAYGAELSSFIQWVEYVDLQQEGPADALRLTAAECAFGYRNSIFKTELKGRAMITRIGLRLSQNHSPNIGYPALAEYLEAGECQPDAQAVFEAVCSIRRSKLPDPGVVPNVGSFFKNPRIGTGQYRNLKSRYPGLPSYPSHPHSEQLVKVPAAWLIDTLGWKGRNIAGVGVHAEQALVIVNPGHRTGEQVLRFAGSIQQQVEERFGILLEIEPEVIGAIRCSDNRSVIEPGPESDE